MHLKFEKTLDYFLFFIILIKVIFVGAAIGHLILSHLDNDKAQKLDPKLMYWKERTEFVFIISMSILLIYQFHPLLSKKPINDESALLFFLFGWILLFTAKWSLFIKEAPWYERIAQSLE
jgi:hypothetical protein